jgi:hypothetical protein
MLARKSWKRTHTALKQHILTGWSLLLYIQYYAVESCYNAVA